MEIIMCHDVRLGWTDGRVNYFHYLGMCPIVEVKHIENNVL